MPNFALSHPAIGRRVVWSTVVTLAMCAVLVAACDKGSAPSTKTDGASIPAAVSVPPPGDLVVWRAKRAFDLTGDGRPEQLTAVAMGPSYDSLNIILEIRDPQGALLYTTRWSSKMYFTYEPRAGKADSTVERIVRAHLDRILADSAFTPAPPQGLAARIDTPSVEYDLAELKVRAAHSIPDTQAVTGTAYDEVQKTTIPKPYRDSIILELSPRPRFKYFAGGEVTYIIAWSNTLGKFVKTFSCC